ncbi:NUDIX domain-containing protein [Pantoea sp. Aalb]|uniref:NUDIX domain-containing protein n=1 Tax=Pantoea sp. Aalb TaxID=2576762 RepID=UPI001320ECBA|nr:NUDIX domain-containing protein [Pantoea sp. Aalb]MXP68015.1 NUDIX domain-containing protein [Pantoea sp. Aalb]
MIEKLIPKKILNSLYNYDRILVGGIVKVKNKTGILFLKRSNCEFMPNIWEIPSGGIEKGESMLKALRREIKEETYLNIISIGKYESYVSYSKQNKQCIQINFNIICDGTIKLSSEHCEYTFSLINDFKKNLDNFMLKVLKLI